MSIGLLRGIGWGGNKSSEILIVTRLRFHAGYTMYSTANSLQKNLQMSLCYISSLSNAPKGGVFERKKGGRNLVDSCPNCKRNDTILPAGIHVIPIKNTILRRICNDSVCLRCGLGLRESFTISKDENSTSKDKVGRMDFQVPKHEDVKTIGEIKLIDRQMYQGWIEVLEQIDIMLREQHESHTYSAYACHFLYTTRVVLNYLKNILTGRIKVLDAWFKGQ